MLQRLILKWPFKRFISESRTWNCWAGRQAKREKKKRDSLSNDLSHWADKVYARIGQNAAFMSRKLLWNLNFHISTFAILRLWTWRRCVIIFFSPIFMQVAKCITKSSRGLSCKRKTVLHGYTRKSPLRWNLWIFDKALNKRKTILNGSLRLAEFKQIFSTL